jgi:tetratricopeptide (TPR) repeat protein
VNKTQWITVGAGAVLVAVLFLFGRTVPEKTTLKAAEQHSANDGHNHESSSITIDTLLAFYKKAMPKDLQKRAAILEKTAQKTTEKDEKLHAFHQLSRFWADTGRAFEPFAFYKAEAARLESSEKNLTFAAHLFLDNLQNEETPEWRKWKALQAKDLFERSLTINPGNDSSKVGLGACYLFGGISAAPMEGIMKIREVADKDSTNLYAQITLAKGSLFSGQYDKAITRLEIVNRIKSDDLDAILLLADAYERTNDKKKAIAMYEKSLPLSKQAELKSAIEKRIEELKK